MFAIAVPLASLVPAVPGAPLPSLRPYSTIPCGVLKELVPSYAFPAGPPMAQIMVPNVVSPPSAPVAPSSEVVPDAIAVPPAPPLPIVTVTVPASSDAAIHRAQCAAPYPPPPPRAYPLDERPPLAPPPPPPTANTKTPVLPDGLTHEPLLVNSWTSAPAAASASNAAPPEPSAVRTKPSVAVPEDTPVAATFAPFSDAPVCVCPVLVFSTSARRLLYCEASAALPAVTVPLFGI